MRLLEKHSIDYPPSLAEIPGPPKKLWLEGTLPTPDTKLLTVVGSRAVSHYARQACDALIAGLAGYPISIVSGLALGTDACAHRAALRSGLHTIAVPGSGLSREAIYPRAHLSLADAILRAGGALLSEHEEDYQARPYDFPSRNRIMVGLSHAVLMIEAREKSGTLITARMAADYNRELLCVPHRIGDPHGFGSHLFLRMGATVVSDSVHILEALGIEPRAEEAGLPTEALPDDERSIAELLTEPRSREEIIRLSQKPVQEVLYMLGMLELKGIITEEYGLWRQARRARLPKE